MKAPRGAQGLGDESDRREVNSWEEKDAMQGTELLSKNWSTPIVQIGGNP